MKKKATALVLAIVLGVTLSACGGSAGKDAEDDGVQNQEAQKEEAAEEESLDTGTGETENDEKLNEFGVTDAAMDILMEKFKENMQENPSDYLNWEMNESYENVCTGFKTFEEAVQAEGNGPVNGMMMGLAAGEDLEAFLPSALELAGSKVGGVSHRIQDSLITAIAEWKEEEGIEGEEFNTFCEAILKDYEKLKSDYMAPVYNEMIEGEAFQEALEQAQTLNG